MFWQPHRYSEKLLYVAGYFAIVLAFVLPLSKTGTTVALLLILVPLLFSGDWKNKLACIYHNPIARIALILYLLFGLSLFYTPIDLTQAIEDFAKHRLLIFLLLIPLFTFLPAWFSRWCIYAFILGCVALTALSLLNVTHIIQFTSRHSSNVFPVMNHIFAGFVMAFAIYLTAQLLWEKRGKSWLLWIALVSMCSIILFASFSRTGHVLVLLMLLVFLFQKVAIKKLLPALLLGIIGLVIVFSFSPRVQEGFLRAYSDVAQYEFGEQFETSVGSRLEMLRLSFLLWQEKPWLGHGIGSFLQESIRIGNLDPETQPNLYSLLGTPHNQYAFITVQLGLIGLLLFVSWLIAQFYFTRKLPVFYAQLGQGLVILFAAGCFSESMLSLSIPGKFYAFFLALIFSKLTTRSSFQRINANFA